MTHATHNTNPLPAHRTRAWRLCRLVLPLLCAFLLTVSSNAQGLGSNCTATLLNHSVQVNTDGTFNIPNVPYGPGLFRIHVTCVNADGTTSGGESDPQALIQNGGFTIPLISVGAIPLPLTSITASPASALLGTVGSTDQITVRGTYADGSYANVSGDAGTTYQSSNPAIATVSASGLLTAVGAGVVTITVRNDGLVATTSVNINALVDTDGDGMPDAWEIAHGLNPYDPTDAGLDPDNDGLTNLQEYQHGTDPHVSDTDGDGLPDGKEVALGTNPLVADSDGDGLTDGQEVALGTNPLIADTDGDGIPDGLEVKLSTNPLVADPVTTVTGRVIDGNNKPVAGASVTLLKFLVGTTDLTGAFSISFVPTDAPGGATLTASVLASVNGTVESGTSSAVAGVAGGTTNLGVIQLGLTTGVVTGTVVGPTGKPVAGAQIAAAATGVTQSTTTSATGTYTFTNIPVGAFTVSALDPATSLRGQAVSTMTAGSGPVTLNITLGGYGAVAGSVLTAAGGPAGSGVTVALSGSARLTTTTGPLGAFSFPFVPLGAFVVTASDASGDTGTSSGFVASTNETITANITFLGKGTVSGTVADTSGNVAVNATVTLLNSGTTPQTLTTQTDSAGHYSLANVNVGSFAVSAGVTQGVSLGGTTMASLTSPGQTLTVNITLNAAGAAKGVVVHADGKTAAANVNVMAQGSAFSTTTDANGNYQLNFLPGGNVTLRASDPSDSDQGQVTVPITVNTVNAAPQLTLNGVGTAVVTVNDASGNPVPSAQLTLTSDTSFTQQLTGLTSTSGAYTFVNVLAGAVTVMASNPANQLAGTAQGTIPSGGSTNITVQLQAAGTISGTVFQADGVTPVPGVTVQLDGATTTVTGTSGTYQFATVPSGSHQVLAIDGTGFATSATATAVIATQGQTVTANLTLIGRGTVSGVVTNADGSAAALASVTVQSLIAGFVRSFYTDTDINGNYSIGNVPVGPLVVGAYTVTASVQTSATLPASGAITVSLTLSTAQTRAAQTFTDANGFTYDVDTTGELGAGFASVFLGVTTPANDRHSDTLTITNETSGAIAAFNGAQYGALLQNGQEVAIAQNGVAGLNVTRHVFVPSNGYMARYLEVLTNPTSSDIIATVSLQSSFRFTHEARDGYTYEGIPQVDATSSGDASFNITTNPTSTDRWLVSGTDEDLDPFLNSDAVPTIGYVFDDGNGAVSLTSGSFNVASVYSQLQAAWQHVRVPANSTVELMHFTSQQVLRAAAQASVQRLVQLPPEALTGLSASDAAAILNFKVPSNLTSTVAALPTLTGSVNGQVFAGDGTTPVPAAIVSVQSVDPLFFRTYTAVADGSGSYSFFGNVVAGGGVPSPPIAIPIEGYNVSAVHPVTAAVSPKFSGTLTASNTQGAQPVVFSNTGQQKGTVRLNATTVVANGTVTLASTALAKPIVLQLQADGTYGVTGLPVGSYTATANVAGTFLNGSVVTQISSGATAVGDITIVMGGTLQGQVLSASGTHAPLPNITVYLALGTQSLSAVTNSTGTFVFTDVPPGTYTLTAYDPISNTAGTASATVTASNTATQNITLASTGGVSVTVTAPSGTSVSGLTVTLTPSQNGSAVQTATTNSAGVATFAGVPVGSFTVSATGANSSSGTASGVLGLAGQTAQVTLAIGPHGVVSGTVYTYDGKTPAAGIQVQLYGYAPGAYIETLLATTATDASGNYLFNAVPVNGFNVTAQNLTTGDIVSGGGTLVTPSQQITLNLTLTGVGTLNVTVLNATGNADIGAQITANSGYNKQYTATTNTQGLAAIPNVLAGSVQVSVTDPTTHLTGASTVTLAPGGTAATTITLQAAATVTGHVYMADGKTAAQGAQLKLYQVGGYFPYATTTSGADGSYAFTSVPLGPYVMNVFDSAGNLRDLVNFSVPTAGSLVTQNYTFDGLGTVQGTVSNPDGSAAQYLTVSIASQGTLGGTFNGSTDGSGNYSIANVPVGSFQISAQNLSAGLGVTATGAVKSDGDIETVNLKLVSNVVSLPQTLTDFNGFPYDIQATGTVANGAFINDPLRHRGYYEDYYYAFGLSLYQNGNASAFTGASTAITTLGGQQLAITQTTPIDGLNVSRKVYTPSNGYFTRYLEVLSNPGTTPVTVDLQVAGGVSYPYPGTVAVTTSSGDAALSTADNTVVTSSAPANSPYPYNEAAMGEAFEGPGAAMPISAASYVLPTSSNGFFYPQLTYRWNSITVPAGGEVAFLHFTTQQTTQGQAVASVTRLDQLPPEGLYGLTSSDLSSIVNFAAPANGTSQLQPLTVPTLGSVTGHYYAYDGATPIPGGEIVLSGTDLYFGATATQIADSNGQFNFVSFPIENYTLQGTDPNSLAASPVTSGAFAAGSSNSSTNVVMNNTGNIALTIVAPSGTQYNSASIQLSGNNLSQGSLGENVGANGTLTIASIPAGTYTLATTAAPPLGSSQGTSFYITQTVTVTNGQTTQTTVNLPQVGAVSGVFLNAQSQPEAGAYVTLSNSGISRGETAGSDGSFSFPQVPNGAYTLMGYETSSGLTASVPVTVAGGAITQNLQIASGGTVNLTVNYAGGQPASNSLVTITRPGLSALTAGVTNTSGQITIQNQPVGSFTITAYYPGQPINYSSISTQVTGSIASNGQTLAETATFQPVSILSGAVRTYSGVAAPQAAVTLTYTNNNGPYTQITADSSGNYSVNPVIAGQAIQLDARAANTYDNDSVISVTTAAAGQTLTQNLSLPVNATVNITAEDANGNPLPNLYINLNETSKSTTSVDTQNLTQQTNASGVAQFTQIPDATYAATLYDSNDNTFLGSTTLTVHTTDDGKTLQFVVQEGVTGTINGTLLAADGATPAPPSPYAVVSVYDTATNTDIADYTTSNGTFTFPQIAVGSAGYTLGVVYQSPAYNFSTINNSNFASGKFTAPNQSQTVNLKLPIPVVAGVVYKSDGVTPAPNPTITATTPNYGYPVTFYGISDVNGNYTVALPIQDQASIFATSGGLTTQAQVNVQSTDTVDTQNITLTTSGTVTGQLNDVSSGSPVPVGYAQIQILSSGSIYTLFTETDSNGNFTLNNVATGTVTVEATVGSNQSCTATGSGQLVNNGDTLTVNLTVDESKCTAPPGSGIPVTGSPHSSVRKPSPATQPPQGLRVSDGDVLSSSARVQVPAIGRRKSYPMILGAMLKPPATAAAEAGVQP